MTTGSARSAIHLAGGKNRRLLLALGGLLLGALLTGELISFLTKNTDFSTYVRAAERMRDGEPIYRREPSPFTYPPLFAVPFLPLTYLPAATHRPIWFLVNVAVVALIFWRLRRCLAPVLQAGLGVRQAPSWLVWTLLLVLTGRHLLSPLEYQSHDYLVFLCTLLAVEAWCDLRQARAGLWAGLATALKATPLLFAPLFLWQRRYTALAVMLLAVLGLSFLPDLLFPPNDQVSWSVAWYRTFLDTIRPGESASADQAWESWNYLNQSLAGTVHRLCTPAPPVYAEFGVNLCSLTPLALKGATLAAQLAVALGLFWFTRGGLTQRMPQGQCAFQRFGEGAAVVNAMVLLSPMSSKSHFCVLLLPLAFCLVDFLCRRRDLLVGALLLLFFILGTVTTKSMLGPILGNQILSAGSVTWCAVASFVATGRVLLLRSRGCAALGVPLSNPLIRKAAA